VNLTSGQSFGPMRGELAYTATKAALQMFSVQFAAEVAELGITVNAVGPGPNDTGWMDDDLRAALLPRFPMGRIGRPGGRREADRVPLLRGGRLGHRPGRALRGRVRPRMTAPLPRASTSRSSAPGSSASPRTDALVRRGASVVCLDGGAPGHAQSAGLAPRLPPPPTPTRRSRASRCARGRAGGAPRGARGVELLERGGAVRLGADVEPEIAALREIGVEARVLDPARPERGCRGWRPRPARCSSTPTPARSARRRPCAR
jgi:hypothetical protein